MLQNNSGHVDGGIIDLVKHAKKRGALTFSEMINLKDILPEYIFFLSHILWPLYHLLLLDVESLPRYTIITSGCF